MKSKINYLKSLGVVIDRDKNYRVWVSYFKDKALYSHKSKNTLIDITYRYLSELLEKEVKNEKL